MKAIQLSATLRPGQSGNRAAQASAHWIEPAVALVDRPRPIPGADEVLVRVEYCGLCGSDFHLAEPGPSSEVLYPGLLELPVVLGHEFSGIVVEANGAFPVGTAVTAEEMQWCGTCYSCRSGSPNHCESLEEIGFTRQGAHAEFIAVNRKYLWSLQPLVEAHGLDVALRMGALVEPYAVAYRALFQGAQGNRWLPGSRVAILGAGPIGIAALDLALAAGAEHVTVIESRSDRCALARKLGAHAVHTPESLGELDGIDWVVDAAGAATLAMEIAGRSLRVGGSVCFLARTDAPTQLSPELLITKNARVFGSQGHSGEGTFGRVIRMMASGTLRPLEILESVCTLEEGVQRLQRQLRGTGKVLVRPGAQT